MDRALSLNMDDKLKGHLLLRHANLDTRDKNMVVGATSGKYEVAHISAALRQEYRHTNSSDDSFSHNTTSMSYDCRICKRIGKKCSKYVSRDKKKDSSENGAPSNRPTFYAFQSSTQDDEIPRAIVD